MSDKSAFDVLEKTTTRRRFLREGGIAALAAGVATACKPDSAKAPAAVPQGAAKPGATGGTMGAHDTSAGATALANADAMDAMHEKGIKAFPAKTAGMGNQLMQPTKDKGVKDFELTPKKKQWGDGPGHMVGGWGHKQPG